MFLNSLYGSDCYNVTVGYQLFELYTTYFHCTLVVGVLHPNFPEPLDLQDPLVHGVAGGGLQLVTHPAPNIVFRIQIRPVARTRGRCWASTGSPS